MLGNCELLSWAEMDASEDAISGTAVSGRGADGVGSMLLTEKISGCKSESKDEYTSGR